MSILGLVEKFVVGGWWSNVNSVFHFGPILFLQTEVLDWNQADQFTVVSQLNCLL